MKRLILALICMIIALSGCTKNDAPEFLKIGDKFSVTGVVDYSDEPSDIGLEYCFITGADETEYYYIDIYGEQSKWSSKVFYTKGNDTALLKEYVGKRLTVSGIFDAECHGIPYITNITISDN